MHLVRVHVPLLFQEDPKEGWLRPFWYGLARAPHGQIVVVLILVAVSLPAQPRAMATK